MRHKRDIKSEKKRKIIFTFVLSVMITGMLFLTAFLNVSTYKNNYYDIMTENNYSILNSIVSTIEYGMKYGKDINNYYDIDEIFATMETYCDMDDYFIYTVKGEYLYGKEDPDSILKKIKSLSEKKEDYINWTDKNKQYVLTEIRKNEKVVAVAGISFESALLKNRTISDVYCQAAVISILVLLCFSVLFFKMPHHFILNRILKIVIPVMILMNIVFGFFAFFSFRSGYQEITERMAEVYLDKMEYDIEKVISAGVNYDEIIDADQYYEDIIKKNEIIDSIQIENKAQDTSRQLVADRTGKINYLNLKISEKYVNGKLKDLVVRIIVTTITSLMIAVEILIFIIDVLLCKKKRKRGIVERNKKESIQTIGIVRGLSFFFASFRYMSVAFMSIVLVEIYKPVVIFGIQIPYEILMSIPLASQTFISMITSYLAGNLISKYYWKPVTLGGIAVMAAGTLGSSFASEPVSFILAQMIVGIGLGFAKTAIDIYGVVAASEKEMSSYTSSTNASIIVGFSCSASIGSVIASIFGYQGAYVVMTLMGVAVFFLIYIFGQNISIIPEKEEKRKKEEISGFDFGFLRYILFIILPYFFIMMYVDYFFPVYSNSRGFSTDQIGYVMLLYGIATSYIGVAVCNKISEGVSRHASKIMSIIMLIISGGIMIFAVSDDMIFAVFIVLIIGVTDGIMPSVQFDYLYRLPLSKKIGFSKTVGIEGFFSSAIGAAAPVVFGMVMMYGNGGLMMISVFIAVCSVLFYKLDKIK